MASISGICSSSPALKPRLRPSTTATLLRRDCVSFPAARPRLADRSCLSQSAVTREISAEVEKKSKVLEKEPRALWRRYVDWLYQHKDLGLYLDVSRVGFTDEFVAEMEPRFQAAFKAMEDLEKGAIANPDEGRMVGHYWLRDPARAPNSFLRVQIENTLQELLKFSDDVVSGKIKPPKAERFTQILSVGIGGSALGPQFVAEALAPDLPPLKIRFIDNTDPAGIDHQIAQLGEELASTLVIVISKSGGTPETRNGLLEVQKAFREAGLSFAKQGVAITQENSLLDNTARIEGWLARFPMFDWVGGRTSEMSAVGLLPAALQGIDIKEMLAGGKLMDEANRTTVVKNNPAALLALCWYWATDGLGSKDMVVLPYKDSLLLFSRYLQQLVMESIGKEFDLDGNRVNQGLTVYGNKGSTDQHAYLSYVMDVATPTADCLNLVYNLLKPVLMKGHNKSMLSFQENRILGETKDQIERILALAFENYKSLDESSLSGIMEVFRPATGHAAPALEPAVKLYTLLHDVLSPEVQTALCHYFQVAVRKRSRRHSTETDEYTTNNSEGILSDPLTIATAYQKMKSLCLNISNEIRTDIEIHNQHILPSFIDLPHLASSIYSTELCARLRSFLIACPPSGPSPPVAELVIATADFQRDLASWNISPIKAGVDAKELFHLYIMLWIQDKRQSLLEVCKLDKVKWSGVKTRHSTTPFVDEMYERLKGTLSDYEVIICRWPEYTFVLESAIADVEKAIIESLDKQYADVLAPLKENLAPKKFGLKYVQKLAKRSVCPYAVPDELGILLNSLKRMLDALRPQIEVQFRSWASCIPDGGQSAPGERLSEVTVMLRAKFRNYLQAAVEKLAENTKLQSATKLKKILQDSKETVVESDVRSRMQPLQEQLTSTINHLHSVLETHVFIAVCRGYWDRMGQDVLSFLENRKENRSWYKGSRVAVSVIDDTFASQMQQLLGNALLEKDLEAPRCIMEVRSMLCKDAAHQKDNSYYF